MTIPITEVRITIPEHLGSNPYLARCDVTLGDCLVIHGVRVIRAPSGRLLVAMPSRPFNRDCRACHGLISQRATFCPRCGARQGEVPPGNAIGHHDYVHPLNHAMRSAIESAVLHAYEDATRPVVETLTA